MDKDYKKPKAGATDDREDKSTILDATIPNRHRFESWLLHFRAISLIMAWETQQMALGLGSTPQRKSTEAPGSWLWPGPVLAIVVI